MEEIINVESKFIKENISISDFQYRIKKLFESSNISFLFGSGYSVEKLSTLGNIEELSIYIADKYKDSEINKTISLAFIYSIFFMKSIYPCLEDLQENKSFENSDDFIRNLITLLDKREDKNLLKRINLFTTNYDLYLEMSMDLNRVFYNDGFVGKIVPKFDTFNYNNFMKKISLYSEKESQVSNLNLYKIHGSLTWEKFEKEIIYNKNISQTLEGILETSRIFNEGIFVHDNDTNLIDILNAINDLEEVIRNEIFEKSNIFLKEYNKLKIINPTKKKFEDTLLDNNYYDILRLYSAELEKFTTVLFVFGFSFSDEHIRTITQRALQNKSMIMYIFIYEKIDKFGVNIVDKMKTMFEMNNNVVYVYLDDDKINLKKFTDFMFSGNNTLVLDENAIGDDNG